MSEECQLVLFYVYVSELKGSNKWEMAFLCLFCINVYVCCQLAEILYNISRC